MSYSIPYQLPRDNARDIAVVHANTRKRVLEMTVIRRRAKKGTKRQKRKKEKKGKERKTRQKKSCMRAGRRPVAVCSLARNALADGALRV